MRSWCLAALVPLFLLISALARAADQSAPLPGTVQTVTIRDPVRAVYYSPAPQPIAESMERAVQSWCREQQPRPEWLCAGGALHYLRTVNSLVPELSDGYVCRGKASPGTKYYREQTVENNPECVEVGYDENTKTHT